MTCLLCHPWRWEADRPADEVAPSHCSARCAWRWYSAMCRATMRDVRHYVAAGLGESAGRYARVTYRWGRRLQAVVERSRACA